MNDCILLHERLKNDESVTRMFRNSDPVNDNPEKELDPDIKIEPDEEIPELVAEENASVAKEDFSDMNGSEKKPQFVQIKNREVFDYEPTANSIHASLWPHWWLRAVQSRHKLRKAEARTNVRFRTGLLDLLREAIEVSAIEKRRKYFSFFERVFFFLIKMQRRQKNYH